ncbi:hypothetical protein ACFQX8_17295 [Klenkia terrae]|uniref:hypothetical protein n=1 Tax=Klenkia terrae TaxID=1052259 RepID=UPI00360DD6E4
MVTGAGRLASREHRPAPLPGDSPGDVVVDWYASAARDLPWRQPGVDAWAVLVSEVMLQQTPVARVEPAWRAWLARWPSPLTSRRRRPVR